MDDGAAPSWVAVCLLDRITVGRGVAALVEGAMVAIFRATDDDLYAIDHVDPVSRTPVLARGLVGDDDGTPTVSSPAGPQRYDLRTGACVDDDRCGVRTWPVRVVGRIVEVDTSAHPTTPAWSTGACAPAAADVATSGAPSPAAGTSLLVRSMSTGW